MGPSLRKLTDAVAVLSDEGTVLELAVRALHEACGRGAAFGMTSRGERSQRKGAFCVVKDGALFELDAAARRALPLAYVRTPAYDVRDVPEDQRNRWVEPFRDGVASVESFRKSAIYPLAKALDVLHQGRLVVCVRERQVAMVGAGVPEAAPFTDEERARLVETSAALVVPLRVATVVAAATEDRSALDRALDAADDALLALGGDGAVLGSSLAAFDLLRRDRALPERLRAAAREARGRPFVARSDAGVLRLSPCSAGPVAYLAVVDGARFAEPPIALTSRQAELLALLEEGRTNAELAAAMGIAPATVKTMLERLYQRSGAANRVELLAWARRHGPKER